MPARYRPAPLALALTLALVPGALRAGELGKALERAQKAAQEGDAAALGAALETIVTEDGKQAVRGLLEIAGHLPAGREAAHWQLLRAAAALENPRALEALEAFLRKGEPAGLARDVLFALQGRKESGHVELFAAVLGDEKAPAELRGMSCDRLGEAATPAAMDALLRALGREQGRGSELERQLRATLVALAGEDMGDVSNWKGWWEQHRDQPLPVRPAAEKAPAAPAGGDTVRGTLDPAREGGLGTLTRSQGRVLVLKGRWHNYDQIEAVLTRMGVAHQVMTKYQFKNDPQAALAGTAAVILDCNQWSACVCPTCKRGADMGRGPACGGCDKHDVQEDDVGADGLARLKEWVRAGGCLFSEDYGLYELLVKIWPEYVAAGEVLADEQVDWVPAPGQTAHPLLRGVFGAPPAGESRARAGEPLRGRWKVDAISPAITIKDPARVQVLLFSPMLQARKPELAPLAITFSPGAEPEPAAPPRKRTGGGKEPAATRTARPGLVLHVLSHFGKQTAREDEFALQNLLVNFLLEANARFAERRSR